MPITKKLTFKSVEEHDPPVITKLWVRIMDKEGYCTLKKGRLHSNGLWFDLEGSYGSQLHNPPYRYVTHYTELPDPYADFV